MPGGRLAEPPELPAGAIEPGELALRVERAAPHERPGRDRRAHEADARVVPDLPRDELRHAARLEAFGIDRRRAQLARGVAPEQPVLRDAREHRAREDDARSLRLGERRHLDHRHVLARLAHL